MRVVERVVERPNGDTSGRPFLWHSQFKEAIRWLVWEDEVWWEERDQSFLETGIEQRRVLSLVGTIREHGPTDPVTVEALANFVETTPVMLREMKSLTKRFGAAEARRMVMKSALQAAKDMIRFCSRCGLEPRRCECEEGFCVGDPMGLR